MIKNEREYAVTRSWVRKFEATISGMEEKDGAGDGPGGMPGHARRGLQSQVDEMKEDMAEYERLRSGGAPGGDAASLEDLPGLLIRTRISRGMTQRDLAEAMGLPEQQIQRYEKTGYGSASYARLMEVHAALASGGPAGTGCGDDAADASHALSRARIAGLGRRFVDECIVGAPRRPGAGAEEEAAYERKLLSRLRSIYGWTAGAVLGSGPLAMPPVRARFKAPARADHSAVVAHAVYAGHVAGILAKTAGRLQRRLALEDPYELRRSLQEEEGAITFPRLVEYAWSTGTVVAHLPPLAFHAACFSRNGVAVVVLARNEASESRLMFDLVHELYHAGRGQDRLDIDGAGDAGDAEERDANRFAHAVLVGRGADRLFKKCMDACVAAGGAWDLRRLGRAVTDAAAEGGVRGDSLANYVAYRLGDEGIHNWWGAAQNMQVRLKDWRGTVSDALSARADLAPLSDREFDLLSDVAGVQGR